MIEIRSVRSGLLSVPELILSPGIIAVTGPNGSGKTSLLEMIAGLAIPELGTVLIKGREPGRCTIGWIGEFPDLNMTFNRVFDEIASPLRFTHQPCSLVEMRTVAMAEASGLTSLLDRPVRTLSGGEKVLVALSAALIAGPDLLILDETDSHLDSVTLRLTDRIIAEAGLPMVLFATHRPDRIATADRVVMMQGGQVSGMGTPDDVYRENGGRIHDGQALHRVLRDPALWRAVYASDS